MKTNRDYIEPGPTGERSIERDFDGPHGPEGPPCTERPGCPCDECNQDENED